MPVKPKKFGAFAGVFTPSILTILGVIMYLRLGWVVGQAGLISALIIIILAHVISVATGLSISSIATDKKIKAGGIYYMLSRSLGLPMGGAIGIALFTGTALSISLYLIGFAESFLSIEPIRNFLCLAQDINGYRIVGTAAILILVAIAFVSTSLALKTQYYILGAIVLSLISLFVGFFIHTDYAPEIVLTKPLQDGLPLEIVFAVFFPAVTGFTAGVAMSGDLKDPKNSIPRGTLLAIIVGFIVYVGLAICFAFFVNRDTLVNDTNFLLKIAWLPALVIAGIWGATLSSAMGGILGGPRILQATSSDKITPRFFGKGYGANNEPRNALIFIFLIAEAGILIGELNIIAGIVSMFYLASYGFINIAYYLESWASTDFRPTFRINRYVGLIGFIASFGVMFQLDMLSMFAALIIMLGLYFLLKRKQLKLEYGDVWHSVWSSIMRTALEKMDNTDLDERNWQPNIILFSGGTKKRPHLIEVGKSLVGRHGVLSNFDLIENKEANVLFPKNKQSLPGEISEKGFFTRRQTVKDIFEGIETISRTYGFSGIEPNTVMMGWARQTKRPKRFAELLNTLNDLDLNILLLDYQKGTGFGKYNSIDIWWVDKSNHGNFAVTLAKLLILSREWHNAMVRILIVNSQNNQSEKILSRADNILENMRIDASVKVINNQIEQKSFYDIVLTESGKTDLVFLGIPDIIDGQEAEYISRTNKLLKNIGTVMLIKASSNFKDLKLGMEGMKPRYLESSPSINQIPKEDTSWVSLPEKPEIETELNAVLKRIDELIEKNFQNYFIPLFQNRSDTIHTVEKAIIKAFDIFQSKFANLDEHGKLILLNQLKSGLLSRLDKIIQEYKELIETEKTEYLNRGVVQFINELSAILNNAPEHVRILYSKKDLEKIENDSAAIKRFKLIRRIFNKNTLEKEGVPYKVQFRKALKSQILISLTKKFSCVLSDFGKFNIQFFYEYQKLLFAVNDGFTFMEKNTRSEDLGKILIEVKTSASSQINDLDYLVKLNSDLLLTGINKEINQVVSQLGNDLSGVNANAFIDKLNTNELSLFKNKIFKIPAQWASNQEMLFNSIQLLSIRLLIELRLKKEINSGLTEINTLIQNELIKKANALNTYLTKFLKELERNSSPKFNPPKTVDTIDEQTIHLTLSKINDKLFRNIKTFMRILPDSVDLFTEETANEITNIQYEEPETLSIPISRLADEYLQSGLIEPLIKLLHDFEKDISNAILKIKDSIRLIRISYQMNENLEAEEDFILAGDVLSFVSDQKQKISSLLKKVEQQKLDTYNNINGNLEQVLNEFAVYRLLKSQETKAQVNNNEDNKGIRLFKRKLDSLRNSFQKQKAKLWHSQSEAKLYTKRLLEVEDKNVTIVNRLLNFKETVSPREQILKELPFYYQQLFTSKYNFQTEFWQGRKSAIQEAEKTYQRYQKGYKGAIVIKGERRCGKSFFANYLVSEVFNLKNKYMIYPPLSGSTDPNTFRKTINETLKIEGSLDTVFENVKYGSTIVFDDLELWWEKSQNGMLILDLISDLIKKYSGKCLFILVVNQESYAVISQLSQLDNLSINTIQLKPFNSKEIQEMILFRHNTSELDFKLKEGNSRGITLSTQARFFLKIFQYSGGNVGAALLSWISSISDFKEGAILLEPPRNMSMSVFDDLKPDLKLYLTLLILHKRLTLEKLQRITMDEEVNILENIDFLKRSGLIIELAGKIFEIDRFMVHPVMNYFFDRDKENNSR